MRQLRTRARDDAGIGLTEVAVAIVVLGIILVGLFPLAVNSIQLAARNAETAQANRVVSAQLDEARVELRETDCGATTTSVVETYTVTRTVAACPAPQRLAYVTVSVAKTADPTKTLSSAETRMIVRPVVVAP